MQIITRRRVKMTNLYSDKMGAFEKESIVPYRHLPKAFMTAWVIIRSTRTNTEKNKSKRDLYCKFHYIFMCIYTLIYIYIICMSLEMDDMQIFSGAKFRYEFYMHVQRYCYMLYISWSSHRTCCVLCMCIQINGASKLDLYADNNCQINIHL